LEAIIMSAPRAGGFIGRTREERLTYEAAQAARLQEQRERETMAHVTGIATAAQLRTEMTAIKDELVEFIRAVIRETEEAVKLIVSREDERDQLLHELKTIAFYVDRDGDLCIVRAGVKEKVGHVMGPQGVPGPAGSDSTVAGPPGPQGVRGDPGDRGSLPTVRKWEPNTVYYLNDVVTHGGSTYQALADNEREPGSAEAWTCWTCLAAAGTNARQLNFRGAYKPDEVYDAYDVAVVGGSSFVARHNRAGVCPGSDWVLVSGVGKRGLAGARGQRGERGERGADGAPAPNPLITGWRVVREQYAVVPLGPDGEVIGAPLYLREMFEQFVAEKGTA
jgi:hypothetical protein